MPLKQRLRNENWWREARTLLGHILMVGFHKPRPCVDYFCAESKWALLTCNYCMYFASAHANDGMEETVAKLLNVINLFS